GESVFGIVDNIKKVMTTYGISRPMWITEGGWGTNSMITSADMQAGFLAQRLLLTLSRGVERSYWYQWDNTDWGTLWTSTSGASKAGVAFSQVYNWIVGSTLSSACVKDATTLTWKCSFTRADGVKTLAVWNAATSVSFAVPTEYTSYRDLAGNTFSVSGSTVGVGYNPILLMGGTVEPP